MDSQYIKTCQYNNSTAFNTSASGRFRKKTRLNTCGFVQEYLHSCRGYGPGRKRQKMRQVF